MFCTTRFMMASLLVLSASACSDPATSPVTPVDDADTADDTAEPDTDNNGNNGADVPIPDVPEEPDVPDDGDVPDEPDLPDEDGGNNGEASCSRDADCGDGAVFCRIDVGLCDDPNARGVCTPRPRACPGALEPVCGCDGRTQRNECQASQAGISLRHVGACADDPVQCGNNDECPDGAFCECQGDACEPAVCVATPANCDGVSEPVCGCDGVTYDNDCARQVAGTCRASDGACPPQSCGGIQGLTCPNGEQCDVIAGACGVDDAPGTCMPIVDDCDGLDAGPVCGCDGTTYPGECSRRRAGVTKEHDGECRSLDCQGTDDCAPAEFCALPDGCIDGADGVCELSPQDCTGEPEDRVCGCDERTYRNDCERNQAGVGKLRNGRCSAEACGRGDECSRNREFCELSWCIDPNSSGLCIERPRSCLRPQDGEEVCGCDGETYGSDCLRREEGVPLFAAGACNVCSASIRCGRGTFCEYGGGICGEGRSTGLCAPVPVACPRNVDPVCGCDGHTYTNDCNRRQAGIALDHTGGCR